MVPLKVYIVDDSTQLTEVLSELIGDPGKVVVCGTAGSVKDANAGIARLVPDVIIADLQLSDGTGFDVVKSVRGAEPAGERRSLIILFSNHVGAELRRRALEVGADHFLDKSNDHALLVELVQDRARVQRT